MKTKICRNACMMWVMIFQIILMACRFVIWGKLEFLDLTLVVMIGIAWAFELYGKQCAKIIEKLREEYRIKEMANEALLDKTKATEDKIRELEELNDSLLEQLRSALEYAQVNEMSGDYFKEMEVQNEL